MEEEPGDERERPGYPDDLAGFEPAPTPPAEGADTPAEQRALEDEADEIRRMVDAGAGSQEEIRDLAARLREHRAREEALWRSEVKPGLVKEGKGRIRNYPRTPRPQPPERQSVNLGVLAVVLLGLILLVLVAANTTGWVLFIPLLGLLVWAWNDGRKSLQ